MGDASKYRPEIDGLRAVAVISVIMFHTGLNVMPGGYVGVDVFFVISGFLITNIIYTELREERFSIVNFYERRIRRLFPAFFVVVFSCSVAAWVLLTPGELKDYSQSVLASTVFLSNLYFFLKTDYFSTNSEELPLLHTWSLSLEEQFYALFPILLIWLFLVNRNIISKVLGVLLFSSLALSVIIGDSQASFNFYLLPTRGWELLVGSILAVNFTTLREFLSHRLLLSKALELLGGVAVVGSIFLLDSESAFPGVKALPVVFGTALLILTMHPKSPIGRVLSSSLPVGLGLISYSAYLIHQPLFVFGRHSEGLNEPVLMIVLVPACLVLAYLSWRYVEKPFRSKNWVSRKAVFGLGITTIVISAAAGAAGHLYGGFPQRFDSYQVAVSQSATISPYRDACHTDGLNYLQPELSCVYGENTVEWAVFGDSHAVELALILGDHLEAAQKGVRHLSFSGCPPALLFAIDNPGCNEWVTDSLNYLIEDAGVTSVVLVYRYGLYLYGDHLQAYPDLPDHVPSFGRGNDPRSLRSKFWESLAEIVMKLSQSGKKIYLLEPIPELPSHIDKIIFSDDVTNEEVSVQGTSRTYYQTRQSSTLRNLKRISEDTGAVLLSASESLCDENSCFAIKAGQALYFDDNHISLPGAQLIISTNRQKLDLPVKIDKHQIEKPFVK